MPDAAASAAPKLPPNCPLTREQVIDRYFLEHRAKLIDIAALLDRIDRAAPAAPGPSAATVDYRIDALQRALDVLRDGDGERARRVLELFSDPTADPIAAATAKGAAGAHKPD